MCSTSSVHDGENSQESSDIKFKFGSENERRSRRRRRGNGWASTKSRTKHRTEAFKSVVGPDGYLYDYFVESDRPIIDFDPTETFILDISALKNSEKTTSQENLQKTVPEQETVTSEVKVKEEPNLRNKLVNGGETVVKKRGRPPLLDSAKKLLDRAKAKSSDGKFSCGVSIAAKDAKKKEKKILISAAKQGKIVKSSASTKYVKSTTPRSDEKKAAKSVSRKKFGRPHGLSNVKEDATSKLPASAKSNKGTNSVSKHGSGTAAKKSRKHELDPDLAAVVESLPKKRQRKPTAKVVEANGLNLEFMPVKKGKKKP